MVLPWLMLLYLALPSACFTSMEELRGQVEPAAKELDCGERAEGQGRQSPPTLVRVEVSSEGRVRLRLPPAEPDPTLQRFTREDARRVLEQFHEDLEELKQRRGWIASASMLAGARSGTESIEALLRKEYTERYGEPTVPLPDSLLDSPLVMALRRSPKYMPEGIREGAVELFNDPAFLAGVAVSLVVYVASWTAPEPFFTKGFAAGVTVLLVAAFTLTELVHAGGAALKLYEATRNIRTLAEVEEAARRFGQYAGGVTLRVLVAVASWGVAKVAPKPVPGELGRTWAELKSLVRLPQRFVLAGGGHLVEAGTAKTVRVGIKQGVLLMEGVVAGGTGASLRTACSDGVFKLLGYSWHHLATNKNSLSDARGGPWTPLFQAIFAKAGMTLEDAVNKVYLLGHAGPHSEAYHREIFRRLSEAVQDCQTRNACRAMLMRELNNIADEVCTPGSKLHDLATRP